MLETYSPSGAEGQLADLLGKEMELRGFTVRKDQVGNVIGELGKDGPRILLCGHMDTVPGEIPVRIDGDTLYGRGAVDAKSSLAAMLAGSALAKERSTLPFRVTLAGVVEEERSSAGIKAIIQADGQYELAVFGEPSGASNIVIGYKGSLLVQVTSQTRGGHSASPWLSRNSLEEAFEFWKGLRESTLDNDSPSKFTAITGTVTSATAGNGTNSIPSKATLTMDIRVPPSLRTAEVVRRIEKSAERYQGSNRDVRILIVVKDRCEAFLGATNSLAVQTFRWAIKDTIGEKVSLVKKTGTSDMNMFAESYSIPMIAYGPGNSSLDHTENEHVSITEYLNSIEVYAKAIQKFASLTCNPSAVSPTATQ